MGFLVVQIVLAVTIATLVDYIKYYDHPLNISYEDYVQRYAQWLDRMQFALIVRDRHELVITFLNMILYVLIITETVLLLVFFQRNMKSRVSLVSKRNSVKEKRLIKSVIGVCFLFIVTSMPRNIDSLHGVWPHASNSYAHRDFLLVVYSLYQLLDGINHSFNLFVYMAVNSKFRTSLLRLFTSRRALK